MEMFFRASLCHGLMYLLAWPIAMQITMQTAFLYIQGEPIPVHLIPADTKRTELFQEELRSASPIFPGAWGTKAAREVRADPEEEDNNMEMRALSGLTIYV